MAMSGHSKLTLDDIPVINMGQFLLDRMKTFGDSVAILAMEVESAASGLQAFGVQKNDVICVVSPNHPDYLVAFYATTLIAGTFQPVNPMYTKDDIVKVFKQCKSKFIMTTSELLPKVKEASAEFPTIKIIMFGESPGYTSFRSLFDHSHGPYVSPDIDPKSDVAALMSSSGTTGFPKAMRRTEHKRRHFGCIPAILPRLWPLLSQLLRPSSWCKARRHIVDVDSGRIMGVNEEGEIWELIKYKAFQVAPATLEDILLRHDAIADVGVVGMLDVDAGELPRAYVVLKAGRTLTEQDVLTFVADQVAPHMKLRGGVEFVQEIPRTASGKILRKSLRERAREFAASKSPRSN
ncbi:Y0074-like protein [Mya arenaria]|uniref:Y0074-like protein n=1 Tax=Mya arenaria TaxID=6604 RepID=A0ABY7EM86_MYAAR|nr:Y0074-like protein [Mya arenaria]